MDADLRKLAADQEDLVAGWQLHALGWNRAMIDHRVKGGWRVIHQGVYALGQAPLSQRQRWIAAVLSAPGTYLGAASAGACHGFREWDGPFETVVRHGNGGPRRLGDLLVARSTTLVGQTKRKDGIPIVTAERALVDLAPGLERRQLERCFRESIRLRTTTANDISLILAGQRGTRLLAALCDRYATIPYHRCRSDAECRALEVLHDACVPLPQVNVKVGGLEADLVWRRWRFLVEVDSQEFHQFADEDARKTAVWEAAGYTVLRIWANDVYFRPRLLVSLVNGHLTHL